MSRRNFFGWGAGIVATFAAARLFFKGGKKTEPPKTAKLLTRDGKLVEVDLEHLRSNVRLASKKEVQNWVWPDGAAQPKKQ